MAPTLNNHWYKGHRRSHLADAKIYAIFDFSLIIRILKQSREADQPVSIVFMKHFKTISEYCRGVNIDPPKHPHFDIKSFEENMKSVRSQMSPFRHEFYAIAMRAGGDGKAMIGQFADMSDGASVFFNTPFQVLSWDIVPNWNGYYLMFSQDFISQSNVLSNILHLFPFLKIDKSIPLAIEGDEMIAILRIFKIIWQEYHGSENDRFQMIEAEVFLLLTCIRRLFNRQVDIEVVESNRSSADLKLFSRFQTLIQISFYPEAALDSYSNLHSTSYYAQKLNVHPNHLNAIVKSVSGQTALSHIHNHLLALAKSYLAQTDWTVKEIAYRLHFDRPNNFSSFFKRNTQLTPLTYRKKANL